MPTMDNAYAQTYRDLYANHWWWRSRERAILETLQRHFRGSGDDCILDVGCGDGLFFDQLSSWGAVEGVEVDSSIVSPAGPWREQIHVGPFDASFQPFLVPRKCRSQQHRAYSNGWREHEVADHCVDQTDRSGDLRWKIIEPANETYELPLDSREHPTAHRPDTVRTDAVAAVLRDSLNTVVLPCGTASTDASLLVMPRASSTASAASAAGLNPMFDTSDAEIEADFLHALQRMYPDFRRQDVVAFRLSRVRHVCAVSTLSYSRKIPHVRTSIPGVYTVTSAQIVNGTLNVNETIKLAEEAVTILVGREPADVSAVELEGQTDRQFVSRPG